MNLKMFLSDSDTIEKNALFTPWSFIHFLSGFMSYLYIKKYTNISNFNILLITIIIHTIYEIKDISSHTLKLHNSKSIWYDNSLLNSIGDTIAYILGLIIALMFKDKIKTLSNKNVVTITLIFLINVVVFLNYLIDN
jgi:hypothetical protein